MKPTSSATFWSAADSVTRQAVQLAVSVMLARMLSPAEFGTVALLGLFVGVAGVLVEGGFSSALIQSRDVSDDDLSTVFWLNLAAAAIAASVLWLAAPVIAAFFEKTVLEAMTGVMALTLLTGSAGAIQQTQFVKRLDMRPVAIASAGSIVLSGIVAVVMAWSGFGVWALVAQSLVGSVATTSLLWLQSAWRPKLAVRRSSIRRLFGFGGYMLASGLLDVSFNQLYTLLLGRLYGAAELGLYARAQATSQLPSAVLNQIVARVSFPVFARAESKERVAADMRVALQATMLVNAPVMLGMAAVAEPLVAVLFGARWMACAPLLQVLCLAGLMMPLHVVNLQALMGIGQSARFFRLEVAKKVVGIALITAAASRGALGIAWAMVVFGVAALVVNSFYARDLLGYGLPRQIADVAPTVGAASVMAASVTALHSALTLQSSVIQLGLEVTLGVAVFGCLTLALKLPGFEQVRRSLIQTRKEPA